MKEAREKSGAMEVDTTVLIFPALHLGFQGALSVETSRKMWRHLRNVG